MQDEGDARFHLPPVENGKPQVLTDARKARGDVVVAESERGGRAYVVNDPLGYYLAHRRITAEQDRAGKRLFTLWHNSPFRDRYVTMRFEEMIERKNGAGMPISAKEYVDAVLAIGHPKRRVTVDVCCRGVWAGREMIFLTAGLDDLVQHFKKVLDLQSGKC